MALTNDPAIQAIQNLELRQIMASFAYLAYCGQDITTPNPESEILGLINRAMPQIWPIAVPNATWRVVWGPAAFTMPGALYQDNLMFVVQNQSDTTQFVIAIRGTNAVSDLDWLLEDLDILQMIPWPTTAITPIQANAQISESTSIDLQILLAMKDKCSHADERPLLEFLRGQTSEPINLCVTGHSLGGCLAGTFALYLKENRGSWDRTGNAVVCCITFAAPTAGNAAFAAYSDQQFADEGRRFPGWDQNLGTNCDAVRCSLDVAPLGWMADSLRIPDNASLPPVLTIYGDNLNFLNLGLSFSGMSFAIAAGLACPKLAEIMASRNYRQVVARTSPLIGTFKGPSPPDSGWLCRKLAEIFTSRNYPVVARPSRLIGTFKDASPDSATLEQYLSAFLKEAEHQHSSSYPCLLGVPELNCSTIIVTDPGSLSGGKPC